MFYMYWWDTAIADNNEQFNPMGFGPSIFPLNNGKQKLL